MGAAQVGLKNLYYAILTSDDANGATYQTPVRISPAIMAKVNRKAASSVLYADDGAVDTATTVGEVEIELQVKDLTLAVQSALLGHSLVGGVIVKKTSDQAPFVALGFESVKSNGAKRFFWFFKGKFLVPEDEFKTKEDKLDFNTPKIKAIFLKRDYDDAYEKVADTEDPGYTSAVGDNWYTAVQGAADATAPTISNVVPANNATAVVVSGATVVWTFSEALDPATVTNANFAVIVDSTGADKPGSLSLNAARTVVTFTPSTAFAATTAYRAIVTTGVRDLYGNKLAAASATKFTTA